MKRTAVYVEAGISKDYFAAISKHYRDKPSDSKYEIPYNLAVSLGVALRLNLEEMNVFLSHAHYAFNPDDERDSYIKQCIENHDDVYSINVKLDENGYALIGPREIK